MRITQSMILRNTLYRVNLNRDEINKAQGRIATQKKILQPSDDSLGFSQAVRFRRSLSQNKQFLKNIQDAESWVNTTSEALDQLHDYAMQAYSVAQKGADGASDAEIRQSLAVTVRGLLQEAVAISNTNYRGKAVFAGTATLENQPFTLENNVVTYSGNDDKITRKVSQNVSAEINVTGQEIMDTELFTSLSDLVDGLENNDQDAIKAAMERLGSAEKELLKLATDSGSLQVNLGLIKGRLTETNVNLEKYISDLVDAHLEEEIVKLKAQENAYMAALKSTSEILNMNIMNYLS